MVSRLLKSYHGFWGYILIWSVAWLLVGLNKKRQAQILEKQLLLVLFQVVLWNLHMQSPLVVAQPFFSSAYTDSHSHTISCIFSCPSISTPDFQENLLGLDRTSAKITIGAAYLKGIGIPSFCVKTFPAGSVTLQVAHSNTSPWEMRVLGWKKDWRTMKQRCHQTDMSQQYHKTPSSSP